MESAVEFLVRHGYLVLFLAVFAEQIGLPLATTPFLIAAGVLARAGRMDFATILVLGSATSVIADMIQYEVGRRKGAGVLRWVCRISLEPDSCVRRTQVVFGKTGTWSVVIAKFVPGLNTLAPPMAALLGVSRLRFLAFDLLGAVLWMVVFTGLGWLCGEQIARWMVGVGRVGKWVTVLLLAFVVAWVVVKAVKRRRSLRLMRLPRISPEDLKRKLDRGEPVTLVDLRHPVEVEADPATIPGSLSIPAEEIAQRRDEIPRDRDVVLFCA